MEWKTGRKPKMGKIARKIENGPRPEIRKNGPKFGAFFSPVRAVGRFLFFGQFFPIFGLRPVFHSMPGRRTRKQMRGSEPKEVEINVGVKEAGKHGLK